MHQAALKAVCKRLIAVKSKQNQVFGGNSNDLKLKEENHISLYQIYRGK
jgi:hypothetical protein